MAVCSVVRILPEGALWNACLYLYLYMYVHVYVCTHKQEAVHSVEWPQKPLSLECGYNDSTGDSWPKWPAECSALNAFVGSSYA